MRILAPSFYTIKAYLGGQLTGRKKSFCNLLRCMALMYFRQKSYEAQLSLMLLTLAKHALDDLKRMLSVLLMTVSACSACP